MKYYSLSWRGGFFYSQKDKVSTQLWKELGMWFLENLTALPNSETRSVCWFPCVSDGANYCENVLNKYTLMSGRGNVFTKLADSSDMFYASYR